MGLADLTRVTDLFVEGELVLLAETDPPTTLWVNKLNSFEREEAQRDGHAARARTMLAMRNESSPEWLTFEGNLGEMDDDAVREAVADTKANEFFLAAVDAIRQDPEWHDRVEARTRITDDMSNEEIEAVAAINAEYNEELLRRIQFRRAGCIGDLANDLASPALREEYRKAWLETRAFGAFQREYAKTMLFFSVRVCKGNRVDGIWMHGNCGAHRQRALDSRDEVTRLPDGLLTVLQEAAQRVQITGRDARFSGALTSSSGSSAQPSEPEESTPSTQEEMSNGPVSISL